MKQKVVIRVRMEDAKKRSKAMKVAVGLSGVLSAAIEGGDKIVVVGDGVDSVNLTMSLRKHMGLAELISVSAVEEKKPQVTVQPVAMRPSYTRGYTPQYYYMHEPQDHYQESNCCIM